MNDERNPGEDGEQGPGPGSWLAADISEQMRVRLAKAERLKAAGTEPYPVGYPRTHTIAQVREKHGGLPADMATGDVVGVTGRVLLYRTGGKLCFATIKDGTGEIQVMISRGQGRRGRARGRGSRTSTSATTSG